MKLLFMLVMALAATTNSYSQNSFIAYIKADNSKEPLIGAVINIPGTAIGAVADLNGLVTLSNVPNGSQIVYYKALGYKERFDTLSFPLSNADTLVVYLEAEDSELDEVAVSSTRSSRTFQDIPTRIESIGGEELDEKGNMKPGDIRMLLSESTGIQTLQTSATSGNSDIRIQGMDGRYTQILKDGFPLYAGFSGGLGLLQTPPLDLKRVEIIKGSSSTLYGGGAIAGLINLISKTPAKERELNFLINGTSAKGIDINGFYGQRFGKVGVTLYTAYDANEAYDPASIVFAAIPKFTRYTFNPKLFLYPTKNTDIVIGLNTSFENRLGGDIYYIRGTHDSLHSYFEDNKSQRISSELEVIHRFSEVSRLTIKNSFAYFNRIINAPGYTFNGTQNNSFTEVVYSTHKNKLEWVAGANLFTDGFKERQLTITPLRDYQITTYGAFVQNTWDISERFIAESGLRGDYVIDYGAILLPRLSLLYKVNKSLSSRISGGFGYKAPTIFTEESERIIYKNVLPISKDSNKLEHSYGGNGDLNYRALFGAGKVSFSINQLFFYTHLNTPLILMPAGGGMYRFENLDAHIDAYGAETNIKIGYRDFKLFLGYTYTHSHIHSGTAVTETPLTPRHHTNSVLVYEIEGKWKVGLEGYYYSPQKLSDGSTGRDYWLCGVMAEKIWKHFSVFVNFENLLDSRQTRFGTIYTGTNENPQFTDIYAPLDGFVINGGLKLKL